jgi:4-amino-4-deoxy-L-arabinose transferase-like glycosyltransferase
MVMRFKYETYYVPALYATVGILLAVNLLGLMGGAWITLLPIVIQISIVVSVYARKTWAYVVVRVWSAICILSGTTLWLAVLLRGGEFSQPAGYMVFQTLLLPMSFIFFKSAKVVLSKRVHRDAAPREVHQEQI